MDAPPLAARVRCRRFTNSKKYLEGLEAAEKAVDLDPKLSMAWYNKAVALANLKRYKEAQEAVENALELDPELTQPWIGMAIDLELKLISREFCD